MSRLDDDTYLINRTGRHFPLEEDYVTKNMGPIDRIIRIALALAVAALYFTGYLHGALALVLGALSVVFLLTSLVGSCPLYGPLGFNTRGTRAS